jgi:hypothetical protein
VIFRTIAALGAIATGSFVASGTASSAPLPRTTPTPSSITISFAGDMELGNTPALPANPDSYLAPIKPAVKADVAFANLEGTLTNSAASSKCSSGSTECYAFRVPPTFAAVYRRAGFTVLNSANNHSHDFGTQGVAATSAALKSAGIVQAGRPGQIGLVRVGSTKIAFVDFAPYSSTNDMLNQSSAVALVNEARHHYGASIVIVYMHSGAEGANADHVTGSTEYFYGENRGNPRAFAESMIDHGATMVVASGPHVLRGMEFYRGHLIDYSLGDFANYENFATGGTLSMSGVLRVTFTPVGHYVSARFISIRLASSGQATIDPSGAAAHFVAQLSRDDFATRAPGIATSGHVVPPRGAVS